MGNGVGKLNLCFAGDAGEISRRRHDISVYLSDPLYEGLGHSFCYFRQDPPPPSAAAVAFKSISGASLSANTSTPLSIDLCPENAALFLEKASSFESSDSFASIPLQPIPRNLIPPAYSAPIPRTSASGPIDKGFERGFLSGPIERSFISGPLENQYDQVQKYKPISKKRSLMKTLKKILGNSVNFPVRGVGSEKGSDWSRGLEKTKESDSSSYELDESFESMNVQWAQGKAGEDRVHMVISEDNDWVFVGIYDGFNGPDATDFLLSNLYSNVHKELKGLLWDDQSESDYYFDDLMAENDHPSTETHRVEAETCSIGYGGLEVDRDSRRKRRRKTKNSSESNGKVEIKHLDVLKALSEALRKTEESFLEITDLMLMENPELSLMGSCVLVMVMKGEDVYLMNVGDSRAVLGKLGQDLERINEENWEDFENFPKLSSLQLTKDHCTSVEEEVKRIKKQHQDDVFAITNDRVKGSLKVTRAFGAGYLKKPEWNNALLKMFRIDYVGSSPYINCIPYLHHHRLGPKDKFLILSSDGLYQYFTNEEAISEIEIFVSQFPEGDPAQHLIEEVLFRAAKKAGMDFHELLDIPQGDRRRYHDDISVIIISFKGRIWRSSI